MKNLDLRAAARDVELPPGDLDAVMTRGATLANRRRRVVAGGLTVALVAVSAGVYSRANRPDPVPVAAGPSTAKRGDVGIGWEAFESRSGLGFTTVMAPNSLYAVSTGPGRGAASERRRVVWNSNDGVDWSQVADLGNDLYIADLADRGARLYGVGTGAATAAVSGRKPVAPLVVGTSDDGGKTWSRQQLPIDVAAISAKSRQIFNYASQIVTTKDAVIAVANLSADLDVPMLLPAGQTAPNGWAFTESGVDVLGSGPSCPAGTSVTPPGEPAKPGREQLEDEPGRRWSQDCYSADRRSTTVTPQQSRGVTASYTFEQLGVGGDLLRAVRGEPMVFRAATDSSTFERVATSALAGLDGPGELQADGDGVLLVGQKGNWPESRGDVTSVLYRTTDGSAWTPAAVPPGFTYAVAVGRLGDRTAMVGEGASGAMLWTSDGQGGWTSTSLAGAVDPAVAENANVALAGAAIGPLGVVAVVNANRDPIAERGGITLEQDGYKLRILNDRWGAVVTDRTGKEIAQSDSVMMSGNTGTLRRTSNGAIDVVDPQTNNVVVTFSSLAVRDEMGRAFKDATFEATYRLLATRDGITWSDQSLSDAAGAPIATVARVLMRGERAVVAASPAAKNENDIPKQIAIVGTPR